MLSVLVQFLMRTTEMCVNGVISDPFVLLWRMNARKMHKYSPFIFIIKLQFLMIHGTVCLIEHLYLAKRRL